MRKGLVIDSVGAEHPDLAAARSDAIRRIRATLEKEATTGSVNLDRSFVISDERGKVLLTVPFRDALL